jgi:hypothetical protein
MKGSKILVLGMGDLGRRIALGLARSVGISEIILAGRHIHSGEAFSRMVAGCASVPVRFVTVDGLNVANLRALIENENPAVIVQCASLMSPWALFQRDDNVAQALLACGFAVQLCAQLPIITNLMQAVRDSGLNCTVVNCSYPDVTHPILNAIGLAPTIGVGNSGMILGLARAALGAHAATDRLQVFAHHAHVGAVACADRSRLKTTTPPRIFLNGAELSDLSWLFNGPAIPPDRELNALSAAHALQIIEALLPEAKPLRTSAPGPLGLPGGWPVYISDQRVELDLPAGLNHASLTAYQHLAAKSDGIERIDSCGTVHFTDDLKATLPTALKKLGDPLHPSEAPGRYILLKRALGDSA